MSNKLHHWFEGMYLTTQEIYRLLDCYDLDDIHLLIAHDAFSPEVYFELEPYLILRMQAIQ